MKKPLKEDYYELINGTPSIKLLDYANDLEKYIKDLEIEKSERLKLVLENGTLSTLNEYQAQHKYGKDCNVNNEYDMGKVVFEFKVDNASKIWGMTDKSTLSVNPFDLVDLIYPLAKGKQRSCGITF